METFIPYNLNKAERENDLTKVISLGPFADVLYNITLNAQLNRKDKKLK